LITTKICFIYKCKVTISCCTVIYEEPNHLSCELNGTKVIMLSHIFMSSFIVLPLSVYGI
jgi:hypothetical protein